MTVVSVNEVAPTQVHALGVVAGRTVRLRQGVGAGVDRGRSPVWSPVIGVGPSAVSVHSSGSAVPPSSLVTVLTNDNDAATSSLLIVHVTVSPRATVTVVVVNAVAPTQLHVARRVTAGTVRLGQRVGARQHVSRRHPTRTGERVLTHDPVGGGGQGPVRLDRGATVVVGHHLVQRQRRRRCRRC